MTYGIGDSEELNIPFWVFQRKEDGSHVDFAPSLYERLSQDGLEGFVTIPETFVDLTHGHIIRKPVMDDELRIIWN